MTIPDDVILNLIAQVNEIEEELGLTPQGVYSDVRVRLDILESRINNPFSPSPTVDNPFIIGNDGVTISTGNGVPTENRVPGSLYLREDGYSDEGVYSFRPDGYWHKVSSSGGGGGSGVAAFTNLAALSASSVTIDNNGEFAYVLSVKDLWIYNSSSALTTDGITVIAANGPGRWERSNLGSVDWRSQATWYVDAVAGNDERNGLTSGTALKTFAELTRRWGPNPVILQLTDIFILNDLPFTDPISFSNIYAPNMINVHGTTTPVITGTLTSYTPQNDGVNLAQIGDTSLTVSGFGPYIGDRIRFTSGAANNLVSWLQRDDGSKKASMLFPSYGFTSADAAPGDSYVIESLTLVPIGTITTTYVDNSTINFLDIICDNSICARGVVDFFGCDLRSATIFSSDSVTVASSTAPSDIFGCRNFQLAFGAVFGAIFMSQSAFTVDTQCAAISTTFLNAQQQCSISITVPVCVQDGYVNAFILDQQSIMTVSSIIWGDNVAVGFTLTNGSSIKTATDGNAFPVPGDFLEITTTTADVSLDGIVRTYAQLPYRNKLTGSCVDSWETFATGTISDTLVAALIGDQNDFDNGDPINWARAEEVLLSADSPLNVTGFAALTSDVSRKTIINNGPSNITLKNQNAGSASSNRIINSSGSDLILAPNGTTDIIYDMIAHRWRTL